MISTGSGRNVEEQKSIERIATDMYIRDERAGHSIERRLNRTRTFSLAFINSPPIIRVFLRNERGAYGSNSSCFGNYVTYYYYTLFMRASPSVGGGREVNFKCIITRKFRRCYRRNQLTYPCVRKYVIPYIIARGAHDVVYICMR